MKDDAQKTALGKRPLVSAVMAAYNTADFIREAIQSGLGQTYSPIEIIVVDDGSTDQTPDILAGFADRIRVIRQSNAGAAAARNTGIQAARGEFMAVLDSDDVWLPDKIERQMALLAERPSLDLIFSRGSVMGADSRDLGISLPECLPPRLVLRPLTKDGFLLDGDWPAELAAVNFIPHSSVLMRLGAVRQAGGYDPALRNTEDYHLYWRIALQGGELGFLDRATFRLRRRAGQLSRNRAKHHENRKRALRDILSRPWPFSPRARRELRRCLAGLSKRAADEAFRTGDRAAARRFYLEAFGDWPRPAQLASWLATFAGPLAPRLLTAINRGRDAFDATPSADGSAEQGGGAEP